MDLQRDLKYWETLMVSSMMQRPIKKLIDSYNIWDTDQPQNLRSALAYGALVTGDGVHVKDLYENIVEIPIYQSHFGQLFDREDE